MRIQIPIASLVTIGVWTCLTVTAGGQDPPGQEPPNKDDLKDRGTFVDVQAPDDAFWLGAYSRAAAAPVVTFTYQNPAIPPSQLPLVADRSFGHTFGAEVCGERVEIFQTSTNFPDGHGILVDNTAGEEVSFWGTLFCVVVSRMHDPDAFQAVTQHDTEVISPSRSLVFKLGLRRTKGERVPRQDGHGWPLTPETNPRFDSDNDLEHVKDVILWADTPGITNPLANQKMVSARRGVVEPEMEIKEGDILKQTQMLLYDVRSKCVNPGPPATVGHRRHIIAIRFGYLAEIVPAVTLEGVTGLVSGILIPPNPEPGDPFPFGTDEALIIANAKNNGQTAGGQEGAKLEIILEIPIP